MVCIGTHLVVCGCGTLGGCVWVGHRGQRESARVCYTCIVSHAYHSALVDGSSDIVS